MDIEGPDHSVLCSITHEILSISPSIYLPITVYDQH